MRKVFFVIIALGGSMVYELVTFSKLLVGYLLYPYVRSVPLWLGEHILIAGGLLGLMVVFDRVSKSLMGHPLIRRLTVLALYFFGAVVFAVAAEVGKPAGGFFYGPMDEAYGAVLVFPIYWLASLIFLGVVRLVYKSKIRWLYGGLTVIAGIVASGLLIHALFTQMVVAAIPLGDEILRSYETAVNFMDPLQYGIIFRPSAGVWMKRKAAPFRQASDNLTSDQWAAICQRVEWGSFGAGILGSRAAQSCFYVGAIIYEEPLLCDRARGMEMLCRADLAEQLNDINVCKNEVDCLSRNPLLLNQQGMSCENLRTEEDVRAPFYSTELSAYAFCDRRKMTEQDSRVRDAGHYQWATTKLVVNEWFADLSNPEQNYIELKNVSDHTITLEDVVLSSSSVVVELPPRELAAGEILLLRESDLRKYANRRIEEPFIKFSHKRTTMAMARKGERAVWFFLAEYSDIPADHSVGVVDLQALREGRYYSDWQEVYQIMPKTPGQENIVLEMK